MMRSRFCIFAALLLFLGCKKGGSDAVAEPSSLKQSAITINNQAAVGGNFNNIPLSPAIRITFNAAVNSANLSSVVSFTDLGTAGNVAFTATVENGNTVLNPTSATVG